MDLPILDAIELQGYKLDVDYYLKREYTDIGEASKELPALVEWISSMFQLYYEDKLVAKQAVKKAEAKAYFAIMKDADKGWKNSDAALTRAVAMDPDVEEAHLLYARLSGWVSRLQNLHVSFQSKLDLVRSTESTRRTIFDQPPLREPDED